LHDALLLQVSEDLDIERERFADLQRTYNAAVSRFEQAQQHGSLEVASAAEAGLRSSVRTMQERMRSMATDQSSLQRALSEKHEKLELLSESIAQLQRSLVEEEARNARLQDEVSHLRQQLASAISMPAPRSMHFDADDVQMQLHRLRQEKLELEERVRELGELQGKNMHWEEQLRQLEGMQLETQLETEKMLGQVCVPPCCASCCFVTFSFAGERAYPVRRPPFRTLTFCNVLSGTCSGSYSSSSSSAPQTQPRWLRLSEPAPYEIQQ
jgi:chromosome segregation ATPase